MSKLTFNIDKKQVAEGEYINVTWDCPNPDMVFLTVEDGIKSIHQLSDSGSRSAPSFTRKEEAGRPCRKDNRQNSDILRQERPSYLLVFHS